MADLTALALNAAHGLPVAELHGVVCGLAVAHGGLVPMQDLVELVGTEALTDEAAVARFVEASVGDLNATDMTFAPLLPEEEAALAARLEALGQWCGSFLAGLAAGLARQGAGSLDDCPEEVQEIVRDFSAIARVDSQASAGEDATAAELEAAESDLVELQEFVKVGVLLMMSVLGHDADDPSE